jgi:hypothetical protein
LVVGAALVVVFFLAVLPFFLSPGSFVGDHSDAVSDSSTVRALKQRLSLLERQIASIDNERKTIASEIASLFDTCKGGVLAVNGAHIQGAVPPDCVELKYGSTNDLGLRDNQMKSANDIVSQLQRKKDEQKTLESRFAKARSLGEETRIAIDEARVEATKVRSTQIDLFLLLTRYGAIGALGAVGFNIILRLGVFQREQPRKDGVGMIAAAIYLIGSMAVAAIIAVIFVPRLVDIPDSAGSYVLTPSGVSYAAAAGLVGDVALAALRRLFRVAGRS